MTESRTTTQCVIAGGGPAGVVLGLLLARAGIDVVVCEKHADFLRDFRGDTVHASTLRLLDELGLRERFEALSPAAVRDLVMTFDEGELVARFGGTGSAGARYDHIALVPQWDLLNLLSEAGRESPHFDLRMSAEVTGLVRDGGRVTGLRYRTADGSAHRVDATLVVGCDGRDSTVRRDAALPSRAYGAGVDVVWFRLPRVPGEPGHLEAKFSRHGGLILIDRRDYWQVAFLVGTGESARVLAGDAAAVRESVAAIAPSLADRVAALHAADCSTLTVQINRLSRWWSEGLLCIGDAAHAMSPVAGVGINLAIQDAVATARILIPALRAGVVRREDLERVQRRRTPPTVATQALQRVVHARVLLPTVRARQRGDSRPLRMPVLLRALASVPAARNLFGRFVATGIRPEHAPPAG